MGAGQGRSGNPGGGQPPTLTREPFPQSDTMQHLLEQFLNANPDETLNVGLQHGFFNTVFPKISSEQFYDKFVPFVVDKYGEKGIKRMITQAWSESSMNSSFDQQNFGGMPTSPQLHAFAMRMWTAEKMPENGEVDQACTVMRHWEKKKAAGGKLDKKNGSEIIAKVCSDTLNEYVSIKGTVHSKPIYRGIAVNRDQIPKVGETWDSRGMASWSTSKHTAKKFASTADWNKVSCVFIEEKYGRGANISKVSHYAGEKEVLVKHQKYKVKDVHHNQTTGFREIYVEAI